MIALRSICFCYSDRSHRDFVVHLKLAENMGLSMLPLKFLRRYVGSITRVSTDKPFIALTFDDGPDPEVTPRVIKLLERYQAHATFFMIGENAKEHHDLVRMVSDAGHSIGNHSWDHQKMPVLPRHERLAQIRNTEMVLQPYLQKLFRPPFGEQNIASRVDALLLGYEVVGWSVHAYDWCERNPYIIYKNLMCNLSPGCIVLLHDRLHEKKYGYAKAAKDIVIDREPMLEALELFLGQIEGRYSAVTVPELIRSGKPYRPLWFHRDAKAV